MFLKTDARDQHLDGPKIEPRWEIQEIHARVHSIVMGVCPVQVGAPFRLTPCACDTATDKARRSSGCQSQDALRVVRGRS